MKIQKFAVCAEEENIIEYINKRTGIESGPLEKEQENKEGSVALILRGEDTFLENTLKAVGKASTLGLPTLVVIGAYDPIGNKILHEAERDGIPKECLLTVQDGKVVDAAGGEIGDALQGTGIGISAVVSRAEYIVENELIPERPLWNKKVTVEDSIPKVPDKDQGEEPGKAVYPRVKKNKNSQPEKLAVNPWTAHLKRAKKTVAVFGIKSGVGASTVAACLAGVLDDKGGMYLEISEQPAGYYYFGSSIEQAGETGRYAYCSETKIYPEMEQEIPLLIADANIPAAADEVYEQADCIVIVTDGSPAAFKRVEKWIKGGWKVDILAVNKIVNGTGYPPEVYTGEFDLKHVIGIPGGVEEETAINLAQRNGKLPLEKSIDFDAAISDLAEAVLEIVE